MWIHPEWPTLRLKKTAHSQPNRTVREMNFVMNVVAGVLLTLSCCTCSPVAEPPTRTDQKKLKYLIEPPVYAEVIARRGENASLPCILQTKPNHFKVKWTKLQPENPGPENIVLISNGYAFKLYGLLGPRVSLRNAHTMDASLHIHHLELQDGGRYRCELINGIEDENVIVTLRIEGVVFPYQSQNGRYKYNFVEAQQACAQQDGVLATFNQLYRAWTEGLDWCNAGWLGDGTVHYPILIPRAECGGDDLLPGLRSYGPKDKQRDRFDAFCFTSSTPGTVFYETGPFSYDQANQVCKKVGAELALVGHLYSAWRFLSFDRCQGGWLRDGSVRFPIAFPRERCGGVPEPGIRSFGFPAKTQRLYGAYCYRLSAA
ncbi:hyaluronan and proteoglycan link protein 2 isoform X1 [Gadus morhua]|uniref:Hyaluronan and proteoglycan link protein 2 n=2 Tax=Gadus morhua TaxID=8049 RepID=A0A8C4Z236_GADMO|nr:hyaluronan and proteoglycan link protein 2 isoform X1 [Gadus morhua]